MVDGVTSFKDMNTLEGPIRLMIKQKFFTKGTMYAPMSGQDMKLYNLCKKLKIKYEEPDRPPYDQVWITPKTINQKLALIQFFGLDLLQKIAEDGQ